MRINVFNNKKVFMIFISLLQLLTTFSSNNYILNSNLDKKDSNFILQIFIYKKKKLNIV